MANSRPKPGQSLADLRPDLAAQWHPTKNGDLTPDQVVAGTGKKLWWMCDAGPDHEWQTTGNQRVNGKGCPFCASNKVSVTNSVARLPQLAAQWHPTRNGDLTPDQVVAGTTKKLWWKCAEGPDHEWQATGSDRKAGQGCPMCAGKRVSVTNSLARFPELVAQWHPTRNGDLTPDQVVTGTERKLWWKCAEGPDHEWQAAGKKRANGSGCPMCAGKRVSVTNSLARFPELVAQWHPTRNGDLTPDQVVATTDRKLWWKCDAGPDHEWQTTGAHRATGSSCPFCVGQRASVTNSLARFPELVAQWHPTRNGDLRPEDIVAGTNRALWWLCPNGPDHEWQAPGNNRLAGRGCPFCAGRNASVTNSVASLPELAAQWHPTRNGDLRPEDVVAGTHRNIWWKCSNGPDHEWLASGSGRVGRGCPFCAGYKVSVTNSVASLPELAAQWHPTKNGGLTPDQVVATTDRKLWWKCDAGPDHEWQATGSSRAARGSGCPKCAEYGYNPAKPGTLYVLCGDDWGKVGISNTLGQRLTKHARSGAFGTFRIALEFADGTVPQRLEKALCAFIAGKTDERAEVGIDGYTESFPARLLDDVLAELRRLLDELRAGERGRILPSGYRFEAET